MTEAQKKDIFKSILVLTVICLVTSALLAIVNSFTSPVSQSNALAREEAARREVLSAAESFEQIDVEEGENIQSAYVGYDAQGNPVGWIFTVTGKGFGGNISVMCAIGTDGRVIGCNALDISNETRTLGGQVAEEEYSDQYIGEDSTLLNVDAISGATVTSNAYLGCVREAFEAYETVRGESK